VLGQLRGLQHLHVFIHCKQVRTSSSNLQPFPTTGDHISESALALLQSTCCQLCVEPTSQVIQDLHTGYRALMDRILKLLHQLLHPSLMKAPSSPPHSCQPQCTSHLPCSDGWTAWPPALTSWGP
jgi:hypothetical protein